MGWAVPVLVALGFITHAVILEFVAYPLAAAHFYPGHPNGRDLVIALQGWVPVTVLLTVTSVFGYAIWRIGRWVDPDATESHWMLLSLQTWGKIVAGFGFVFMVFILIPDSVVNIQRNRFDEECAKGDRLLTLQGCGCVRAILESRWPVELYIPFYANAGDYWRDSAKGAEAMRKLTAWYEATPGVAPGQLAKELADAVRFGFRCEEERGLRREGS